MKLSRILPLVVGSAAAGILASSTFPAQALVFNFQFDNTLDGTITPPIVGTGTFSFDGDLGDGTFALTFLPNYNFSFNFGGDTFTNGDIVGDHDLVYAIISTSGSDRFVNFSDVNPNNPLILFTPEFRSLLLGGNLGNLYEYDGNPATGRLQGTFQGIASAATPVPFDIPGGATIPAVGSLFALALMRKAKKSLASKTRIASPVNTVVS
ncbi:hypothetical protein [Anabaena catenula]|uniref:PEP-CTERM sorting domain-containing protein n=1 Tax=Anabaena catenula FACHB-362 TaxID=2692877 RepID=A0ABR8J6N9_9NOST|nr:hypothetical protein [Anabaena catenula]MBD2694026.1 hypothetical protein [Anabaena catenula FACHB-362]